MLAEVSATDTPTLRTALTIGYLSVLGLICVYGLHRYWLVWLYYRHRPGAGGPEKRLDPLPRVTVQLPMFNEASVASRVIDAACRLDYPAEKLEIQVLDDSDDGSERAVAERVAAWAAEGVAIEHIHRTERTGYKAGALREGLQRATGELVAVFDADFVPPPGYLRETVHHFADPEVGLVQARWDHLNRWSSLLTRCQAVFLDAHFLVEHGARHRAGRWINFNGTAGTWRREAIEQAGGWEHDTLTEDVDLSYRAQMKGWKFVFTPAVMCPAELPPEINAFKSQQHRWTKGSIQTAKKLLPAVLRSGAPRAIKTEAFFHLTSPLVYVLVTLMVLLFYPTIVANARPFGDGYGWLLVGATLFALGSVSAGTFYVVSQREQGRGLLRPACEVPAMMALGIGIAVNNARGCLEALAGHRSGFVRTPKYNTTANGARPRRIIATPSIKLWMGLLELGLGLYCIACIRQAWQHEYTVVSIPFLVLFAAGYLAVGTGSLLSHLRVS